MHKSLLMNLYQSYQSGFAPLIKKLKKEGLNLNDSLILLAIFFEGTDPVTPSSLESTLFIPKDQVSQSIRRLHENQWVTREINTTDGRQRLLGLTKNGKKKASVLVGIFNSHEEILEETKTT